MWKISEFKKKVYEMTEILMLSKQFDDLTIILIKEPFFVWNYQVCKF